MNPMSKPTDRDDPTAARVYRSGTPIAYVDGKPYPPPYGDLGDSIRLLQRRAKKVSEHLTAQLEEDYPLLYERLYWLLCGIDDYLTPFVPSGTEHARASASSGHEPDAPVEGAGAPSAAKALRRGAYLAFVAGFGVASPDEDYLAAANDAFDAWWERIGKVMVAGV